MIGSNSAFNATSGTTTQCVCAGNAQECIALLVPLVRGSFHALDDLMAACRSDTGTWSGRAAELFHERLQAMEPRASACMQTLQMLDGLLSAM